MSWKILTYKQINREEWKRLVMESRTGTWFQTPEAFDFFASMPELFIPFAIAIYREDKNIQNTADAEININKEEIKNAHSTSAMPDCPRGLKRNQPQTPTSELAASVDANTPNLLPDSSTLNAYKNEDLLSSEENGKNGELRGICVGYVTRERSAIKQFFTRRVIILGGPALADDYTDEEVQLLMEAVRKQPILNPFLKERTSNRSSFQGRVGKRLLSPIYIETRNFNDYSRWKEAFAKAGFDYRPHLNFHVDCRDEKAMWERLSENRKRQVRHALTDERISGLVDEGEIREWYEILANLYRTKVRTPLWPVEFFLEAHRQGVGKFLLVKHEGKVIGGSFCVIKENKNIKNTAEAEKDNKNSVTENAHSTPVSSNSLHGLECNQPQVPTSELAAPIIANTPNMSTDESHVECLQKCVVPPYKNIKNITLSSPYKNEDFQSSDKNDKNGGAVYEWFECGLNAEYKEQYPSVMATWAGMKLAHEMGCARYDMMGAGEPGVPYGVRDFKSEFGGELVEHGRFLSVAKPWLYKIGVLAVKLLKR